MWINVKDKNDLQEGDIVELNTEYPLLLHYIVVVIEGEEKKCAHYPYPQSPCIQNLDYVINNRPDNTIRRVLRTGIKSETIIQNHKNIDVPKEKDFKDWLIRYNCENYIKEVTGKNIGVDQRISAILIFIIIILIIVSLIK